jgi:hypothetical protein
MISHVTSLDDPNGQAIEVMAIKLVDESLLIIHAMPLRERYREKYEEAMRWRR